MQKAEEKVKKIIEEEFDSRLTMAVVTYIIDKGWENIKKFSEEDIKQIKGNNFMTTDFLQSLVRCAVRICNETSQLEDFIPFVIFEKTNQIVLDKSMFTENAWENIISKIYIDCDDYDVDITSVTLNYKVSDYQYKIKGEK